MRFNFKLPKYRINRIVFVLLLFIGAVWTGIASMIWEYLTKYSAMNRPLLFLLMTPFISLPAVCIYLIGKEWTIISRYQFYHSEIEALVNVILKSNIINEIDNSDRKKVIQWTRHVDEPGLLDSPRLLPGYIGSLTLGLIFGIPIGTIVYIIGEFVLKTVSSF